MSSCISELQGSADMGQTTKHRTKMLLSKRLLLFYSPMNNPPSLPNPKLPAFQISQQPDSKHTRQLCRSSAVFGLLGPRRGPVTSMAATSGGQTCPKLNKNALLGPGHHQEFSGLHRTRSDEATPFAGQQDLFSSSVSALMWAYAQLIMACCTCFG